MPSGAHDPQPSAEPEPHFDVTVRDLAAGTCAVQARGEIDLATAAALKAELHRLVRGGCRCFVLDLSGVTHLDSTGLGVLVAFQRGLRHRGRVTIAQAPAAIVTLLRLTGLERSFELFPTVGEAVADVLGQAGGADRAA